MDRPLKLKKPSIIGVQFMGDWMHADIKTEWIDRILEVMAACPQHTFLTLTKRPENFDEKLFEVTEDSPCRELGGGDYLPNVWLGVTVCNQEEADRKIPILLSILGFKKWVSVEPILGPIDLQRYLVPGADGMPGEVEKYQDYLSWVVAGGETGRGARPAHPVWFISLRDQCQSAGIPFFFKGWGTFYVGKSDPDYQLIEGRKWEEVPYENN